MKRRLQSIVRNLFKRLKAFCTKPKTSMATQIIDDGSEIRIVTNGVPKIVTKSNVKTVELLANYMIKIDIGKDPLRNFYVYQPAVDVPASSSAADLRDKIALMLQTGTGAGNETTATAANQVLQIGELQNIKNTVVNVSNKLDFANANMVLEPKLIDETEGRVIYKGFAIPASDEADPVWAIQRVTNDDNILSYHWALGTKSFDKQWVLRREYQYA